jgi:2,4-dienoyl-CoA reductase-like NADH-dependent reductase (Old Yellow Enzyme family)
VNVSPLFDEVQVGSLKLRNRIAHPAVIGNYGEQGLPTDDQIAYYEARSAGGAGLIITEGVSVHPSSQPTPSVVRAYDTRAHDGLARLATAVHRHGARVLLQLWHVGRQQLWGPSVAPWGMSTLPDALSGNVAHVMAPSEIREVVQAYITSAQTARDCGFDGIEVHGAHGYLVTQSLSPWSNVRTDDYGGDFEHRIRLVREVLEGVRSTCGPEFAICLKLSGAEFVPGGLEPGDTVQIGQYLAERRLVDMIAVGQGNFTISLEKHVPDMRFPQAPFAEIIREIRAQLDVPVMATGRIIDPEVAVELVENGTADIIGMARSLISDPDAPNKWSGLDPEPVRRCISCNVCWDSIHRSRKMVCIHNPAILSSGHREPQTTNPLTVSVIGGGPAGMETAWVAASRGHQVTLWEAEEQLGGQVIRLAQMPGLSEYGDVLRFQMQQLSRYKVDVRCGRRVSLADLPVDGVVVVATGAVPQPAPLGLQGLTIWYPGDSNWDNLAQRTPGEALVFDEDGGYYAYGCASRLADAGWRVDIVTSRTEVGGRLDYLARIGLQRDLRKRQMGVRTGQVVGSASIGSLTLADVYTDEPTVLSAPGLCVWAGPRMAVDDLWRERLLSEPGLSIPVGDAYAPRDILSAVHEGHRRGEVL